jgi:hypothetical protein
MGLGQVRDVRQASVREIIAQRRQRPFDSVRDLLLRVDVQAKEATNLVQCGALDGLGASRADMLAELQGIRRAGNVQQASFDFAVNPIEAESPAQRLAWESHLLGWPVSVTPLEALTAQPEGVESLADLPRMPARPVVVAGYRLPGWTGGRGFFLCDGSTFMVVGGNKALASPRPWQPILVHGRYWVDEWGSGELVATRWGPL